ncbi:MAG: glutathione S-transferase family protein [Rhizobiales bacterium]|nr:glutathione S-transferase family protein [Hyphomicrobiales bacterium]
MYRLYGNPGWGSVLVEAQLAWYGLDHENAEAGDVFTSPSARDELARLNPLAQVPVLILPDGTAMTESAAITLHLADITGSDDLVPAAREAERSAFLRWLIFLVANIYPTFTFADEPSRFIAAEGARDAYRAAVDAHAQRLWRILEEHARAPWFLGERFSALDIYVCAMTRWRPQRLWFAANTPKLAAIALAGDGLTRLAAVWRRNFPD